MATILTTDFVVDSRIVTSGFALCDWPLSRVFLKNNSEYPWLILVPRIPDLQEIDQLSSAHRHQLMDEMSTLSSIVKTYFKPDKLNIGALGNIVSQLHVHVVARTTEDGLWPYGIWQMSQKETPYLKPYIDSLVHDLQVELNKPYFL